VVSSSIIVIITKPKIVSWRRYSDTKAFCTSELLHPAGTEPVSAFIRCWSFLAYTQNWHVTLFLLLLHPPGTLPFDIRLCKSIFTFKHHMKTKTHLFKLCCLNCLCIFRPKGAVQIHYYYYSIIVVYYSISSCLVVVLDSMTSDIRRPSALNLELRLK